jgi:hypothetical protein
VHGRIQQVFRFVDCDPEDQTASFVLLPTLFAGSSACRIAEHNNRIERHHRTSPGQDTCDRVSILGSVNYRQVHSLQIASTIDCCWIGNAIAVEINCDELDGFPPRLGKQKRKAAIAPDLMKMGNSGKLAIAALESALYRALVDGAALFGRARIAGRATPGFSEALPPCSLGSAPLLLYWAVTQVATAKALPGERLLPVVGEVAA